MPIYEYKCSQGHVFSLREKYNAESVRKCKECDEQAQRQFFPSHIIYVGGGWYSTGG